MNTLKKNWKALVVALALALSAVAGTLVGLNGGAQEASAASQVSTYNFYVGTAGLTTTTYTNEPWVGGLDEIDIFATSDVSGTDTVTYTLQTSYDGTNWANILNSSDSAVTMTASADGTAYETLSAVPGLYMRVKIETSGTVTPTIKGVGRKTYP